MEQTGSAHYPAGSERAVTGSRDDAAEWNELPESELRAFDRWLESTDFEVRHRGWFTAGRTRDPVGLIDVYDPVGGNWLLVLKFYESDGPRKVRAVRRAFDRSPAEFRKAHLVDIVGDHLPRKVVGPPPPGRRRRPH